MRYFILAILIGFPLAEGAVLYKLASGEQGHIGWVLAWVIFAAIAGVVLIKQARFSLIARLGQALAQGQFSIAALVDSFRTVIAGLLLIFPGIISDILAITLLLMPIREPVLVRASASSESLQGRQQANRMDGDRVIEGEFRRDR
ncbi:MAG: FxsA family protein [Pseudomonadota bacterium]